MWLIQPREILDANGKPSGRWVLTAASDEPTSGPFGDPTHDHGTAEEAEACERCDEYCARRSGFPSRRREAELREAHERSEYLRLKAKYEGPSPGEGQKDRVR